MVTAPLPPTVAEVAQVSEEPLALASSPEMVVANDGWLTQAYLMENGY